MTNIFNILTIFTIFYLNSKNVFVMAWNIEDLDITKLQQSIANEGERVKYNINMLKSLRREYDEKQNRYNEELKQMRNRIVQIENSILSGNKYIKSCENCLQRKQQQQS